ncbi:MAG: hypothetical protein RLY43_1290 [Bacteroidota bacterium]|jgi:hypothetical protein
MSVKLNQKSNNSIISVSAFASSDLPVNISRSGKISIRKTIVKRKRYERS